MNSLLGRELPVRRTVFHALALLVAGLVSASTVVRAQRPPIGVRVEPVKGWEEMSPEKTGAAYVFRKRDSSGKTVATFNVVIVESETSGGSILDAGVADGLQEELLQVVPGGKVTNRGFVDIGRFKGLRLTVEALIAGKPSILRQTMIDVRQGVVTATAVVDVTAAETVLPEVDSMVATMAIDAFGG